MCVHPNEQPCVFVSVAAMKSATATVSIRSAATESAIATAPAERRRNDTESGGTERKRRGDTSLLAGTRPAAGPSRDSRCRVFSVCVHNKNRTDR